METEISHVYKEILLLKEMVASIKEEIEERFLTAEEEITLEESLEEFENGKTNSLEELKEELCLN